MKRKSVNLLLVLGLILGSGLALQPARAQGSSSSVDAPLHSTDWWSEAQAYIRNSEYHIVWRDTALIPGAPAGYQAPNRAQNLRTYFYPDGLRLVRRTESEPSWMWGMAPADLGREGRMTPVDTPTLSAYENRITYRRGQLQESYVNAESGLQQTISLAAPPSPRAAGPLLIDLALSGDLTLHRQFGGGLELRHAGQPVLRYSGLHAVDATGRQLPVDLRFDTPHSLRITLDDAAAVYPIRVEATITGLPNSPDWHVEGNQEDANLGHSVATAGDVNRDGYSDVIVGLPEYDGGATDTGMVYVYHGSASGLPTLPTWTLTGVQAHAGIGHAVATAGDVNGDGYSDVIIGAPVYDNGHTDEGIVYVYHGSATGLGASAAWQAEVNQEAAGFGYSVATAGDVNGDGYSDVIIGAFGYDAYTYDDDRGMAAIWLGSGSGLEDAGNPSWITFGSSDNERYGSSVATAGDVNGDGYADVLVGAPEYSFVYSYGGRVYAYHGAAGGPSTSHAWDTLGGEEVGLGKVVSTAGDVNGDGYADVIVGGGGGSTSNRQVQVYHGSSGGLPTNPNWRFVSTILLNLAAATTAGDVNGDGYSDIIVGAPFYTDGQFNEGAAFLWHGDSSGLGPDGTESNADWSTESDNPDAYYGLSVATAGDVNGDGYSDVLVGAPGYTNGQSDEGMAFAFYGGPDNLSHTAGWAYESDYADKNLGWSVATAGDVNGDGYADLMVGSPYYDSGQTDEGAIFLWHGAEQGPAVGPDWTAYSDQADAYLGYSIATAGDVNGDGYSDVIAGAPGWDNGLSGEGAAFVWYGSSSGMGTPGSPTNADWSAESDVADAQLGWSVSSAGDVNGDGYADVAAGAPTYADGNTNEGGVFVWHGSSGGLGTNGTPSNADWHDEGDADNAALGSSVSTAGDVNRDGYSDLIAGGYNFATAWHGSSGGLYTGGTSWFKSGTGYFGFSVSTAGDVNGDGYADVVVGAPYYTSAHNQSGGAWAFYGGSSGLSTSASWTDQGGQADAWFGYSVATAGDVNGDGYADILVGVPQWTNPSTDEGQARVYYGSSAGPVSSNGGDWTLEGNRESAFLGWSVASAGDVNGDGYADVLVGAPGYTNGQSEEGQVSLYYGNGHPGVSLLPRQLQSGGAAPIAPLGRSDSPTAFRIQGLAYSPTGRGKVQLQWEVKPWNTPFNNTGVFGSSWLDSGTDGVTVQGSAGGLSTGTSYHWRMRTKYNPVTNPFSPPHSRWFHVPWNGWNEADLRTAGGGGGTCSSPLSITCGQAVNGSTTGRSNHVSTYSCISWNESGPETIYGFTLTGSGSYNVTAELSNISGGDLDVFLLAAGGCESGQCLTADSYGDTTATAENVPAGTYYVAVDGYEGAAGSYTLNLTCSSAGGNNAPNVPGNPSPAHQATDISLTPTLSWSGGDPDGDAVSYTVVGHEAGDIFYVVWCQTNGSTTCNPPGTLKPGITYEWAVNAEDTHGARTYGPLWQFTTVGESIYLPLVLRNSP